MSRSNTSTSQDSIELARNTLQVDLEKVYSRHEDQDVAPVEILPSDPNVVNWDGPDDEENPLNWTNRKKWTNVAMLAAITTLTYVLVLALVSFCDRVEEMLTAGIVSRPLASSMFAPAVPQMMNEFGESSVVMSSFVVSVYIIGYAFGPLVIAPMSELYGRLWVYHINSFLFIIFTMACGLSTNLGMICAFRFLAGVAGSCPITVGSGSIADTFPQDQRGKVMSIWTFPILFGPSIGPVIGSYLSEGAGWRWDFWLLVICVSWVHKPEKEMTGLTYLPGRSIVDPRFVHTTGDVRTSAVGETSCSTSKRNRQYEIAIGSSID